MKLKRIVVTLAVAMLGLVPIAQPATAQVQAQPTGCTTSIEWVQQGSNYFYGKGNLTCSTGSYKARSRPQEWCLSRPPRDLGLDFRR